MRYISSLACPGDYACLRIRRAGALPPLICGESHADPSLRRHICKHAGWSRKRQKPYMNGRSREIADQLICTQAVRAPSERTDLPGAHAGIRGSHAHNGRGCCRHIPVWPMLVARTNNQGARSRTWQQPSRPPETRAFPLSPVCSPWWPGERRSVPYRWVICSVVTQDNDDGPLAYVALRCVDACLLIAGWRTLPAAFRPSRRPDQLLCRNGALVRLAVATYPARNAWSRQTLLHPPRNRC